MPFSLPLQLAFGFTAPALAAAGAAAVTIPVAIHLLSRMRRQPVNWGAMRFLQLAYRQQKNKLRLENWLLLAVRCLIALLLGLALSGPVLTGCAGGLGGAFDPSGRVVHIVLDDALASAAKETADRTRFERHVEAARQVIDTLEPRDRVALWRAARPARPILEEPTPDREQLARALDELSPRFSASDLPAALEAVGEKLAADQTPADRAVVVVLSDLAAGSDYWTEATPASLQSLGERAQVLVSEPSPEAGNVQVASVTPRRTLVLARSPDGGSAGAVNVSVALRRFAAGSEAVEADVALRLMDAAGRPISGARRQASWAAGQVRTTLNVALPLEEGGQAATGPIIVEATLEPGLLSDTLSADNRRLAAVEARASLRIGLIDEASGGAGITPHDFLAQALSPLTGAGSGMTVQTLPPAGLGGEALEALDAVILLRPDLLPAERWEDLARFTRRGGLVWVITPVADGSAVWSDPMRRAFDLEWRIGLDPFAIAEAIGGLGLDTQKPAPEALELVGANWGELLRPIRVSRKIELLAPPSEAWLALDDRAAEQPTQPREEQATPDGITDNARRTLLAARPAGDGMVLLLASALDPDWTNLPTKPLFVPLLHETLRGVLGTSPRGIATTEAGTQPTLGAGWRDAAALEPIDRAELPDAAVAVRPSGDAMRTTAAALTRPGVYRALDAGDQPVGALLAVNPDAAAGDTRPAGQQQVTQWLSGLGPWQRLELGGLADQLAAQSRRPNIGWGLLWVVLALVLLETFLARTASHAKRESGTGLGRRVLGSLRHLRDEAGAADQAGATTTGKAA
jgi:hypothetical protein